MTTTQGTMYEDFDSSTRNAVLLQIHGNLDCDDLLPSASKGRVPNLYKGGSDQWFVTYELGPDTSDDGLCPQVTRVYVSGELCGWEIGTFATRSGTVVHGVKIEYERTHESYRSHDEDTEYETVGIPRRYTKIIEIPPGAMDIELRSVLPDRYRHALHRL
jgi:hypothetical protein